MQAWLSGLVLWLILYTFHASLTQGPTIAARQMPYLLMGAVLFAAPVALVVIVALGAPAYLALRHIERIALPIVLTVGAAGGLLCRIVVAHLWNEPEINFVPVPVVVIAGAGAAAVWWKAWHQTGDTTVRGTI